MSIKFEMSDRVEIGATGIFGEIIGLAQYKFSRDLFLVAYNDKDGVPKEIWYNESEISSNLN